MDEGDRENKDYLSELGARIHDDYIRLCLGIDELEKDKRYKENGTT